MIKKICFVVLSRANYSSIKSVIQKFYTDKFFKINLVVGASAINDKYGDISKIILKDGFIIDYKVSMPEYGSLPLNMAQTIGSGILELSNILSKIKPDLVFTVGDRYETLSTAITASCNNIPIAHTMGGEVTGTLDESVRHAITKLSHLHFVSNADAKKRVIKLGEKPNVVFNVGCPRIDEIKKSIKTKNLKRIENYLNHAGVGSKIDLSKKFIMIMQHPVTTEYELQSKQINVILNVIKKINIQKIIFWPNSDAGSDIISREIRKFRERNTLNDCRFIKNLSLEIFSNLLKKTSCLIGNSSSGIRDCSFLGTPVVNIGSRQNGRKKFKNVIDSKFLEKELLRKIKLQINKKFSPSYMYGNGSASNQIYKIIKSIKNINIQKKINY